MNAALDQADVVLGLEWCDLGGLYSRPGSRGAAASHDHQRRRGPAGSALREHWLVVVLWTSLSQDPCEDSHADFRIIAEGFYQNDRRCRGRHLWARRGC